MADILVLDGGGLVLGWYPRSVPNNHVNCFNMYAVMSMCFVPMLQRTRALAGKFL